MSYSKQTWTNNVSIANESRMNHIEDGIYQNSINIESAQSDIQTLQTDFANKNIITVGISSNVTIAAGTNSINLNQVKANIGSKLTLSNGRIVIGSGVKHVLISGQGQMNIQTGNGDAKNFSIAKNGTVIISNLNTLIRSYALNVTRGFGSLLLSVSQGDTISYQVYGGAGDIVSASENYLTVEAID